VEDGIPTFMTPVVVPQSIELWKAVAPFATLESSLFAHEPGALRERAEAFIASNLPEANLSGRVA
jgi:hypothetical protein